VTLPGSLAAIFARDLAALRREVEAYPDERLIWAAVPGLANTGGMLVRHLCGNLQHFIGATLGGSGYVRDREHEFTGAPESRAHLLAEIDRTAASLTQVLPTLTPARLASEYPLPIGEHRLRTEPFLVHLAVHLGFHLGQLDYHRRAVTGESTSIGPMGVAALADE
jgi:hypothetical protein